MTATYDDPNREAIGLPPIWTGAGEPDPPPEEDEKSPAAKRTGKHRAAKDDD